MPKQVTFSDTNPDRLASMCRNIIDQEYLQQEDVGILPSIRTRQEAYGYLTERIASLHGAAKAVDKALDDAARALPAAEDGPFTDAAQSVYSSALESFSGALGVAICAMNVTAQLMHLASNETPPMMKLSNEAALDISGDDLPDVEGDENAAEA